MGMFYPIQTLLQAHAGNPQRCERSGRSMSRILALTAPTLVWEAVLICGCCDKRCVPSSKQTTGPHTHPETTNSGHHKPEYIQIFTVFEKVQLVNLCHIIPK